MSSFLLALGVNGFLGLDGSVDLMLEVVLGVLVRFRGVVDFLHCFLGVSNGFVNVLLHFVFGLLGVVNLHGRLLGVLLGLGSFVNGFLGFGDRLFSLLHNLNGLLLGDFALLLVYDGLVGFLDLFMSLGDGLLLFLFGLLSNVLSDSLRSFLGVGRGLLDGLVNLLLKFMFGVLLGGMLGRLGFLNYLLSFLDIVLSFNDLFVGLLNDFLGLSLGDESLLHELFDLMEVSFSVSDFLSSLLLNMLGDGGFNMGFRFGNFLFRSLLSGNLGVNSVLDEVLNFSLLGSGG